MRAATAADVAALATLKRETFRETFIDGFALPYPPADVAAFEAESYAQARIAAEIADPAHATWVVDGAGGLVAYAHIGPGKLPHDDLVPGEPEIYQIYVRQSGQGLGLGRRLLETALAHPLIAGARVWLGVWSGNHKAQAFYARYGFRVVGGYQFAVGDWRDDEFIMRREPAG